MELVTSGYNVMSGICQFGIHSEGMWRFGNSEMWSVCILALQNAKRSVDSFSTEVQALKRTFVFFGESPEKNERWETLCFNVGRNLSSRNKNINKKYYIILYIIKLYYRNKKEKQNDHTNVLFPHLRNMFTPSCKDLRKPDRQWVTIFKLGPDSGSGIDSDLKG